MSKKQKNCIPLLRLFFVQYIVLQFLSKPSSLPTNAFEKTFPGGNMDILIGQNMFDIVKSCNEIKRFIFHWKRCTATHWRHIVFVSYYWFRLIMQISGWQHSVDKVMWSSTTGIHDNYKTWQECNRFSRSWTISENKDICSLYSHLFCLWRNILKIIIIEISL